MKTRLAAWLLALLLGFWLPAVALTVGWDTSTGATGYRLYYGPASRVYTSTVDVGTNLSARIIGLQAGQTVFIAVTAYDATGLESAYSSEIMWIQSNAVPVIVTNSVLTVDRAADPTGPWTNLVTLTNLTDGPAGFFRVNLAVSTNSW